MCILCPPNFRMMVVFKLRMQYYTVDQKITISSLHFSRVDAINTSIEFSVGGVSTFITVTLDFYRLLSGCSTNISPTESVLFPQLRGTSNRA